MGTVKGKGNTYRGAEKRSNQNRRMDGYDKLERDSHNLESRQLMIMGFTGGIVG